MVPVYKNSNITNPDNLPPATLSVEIGHDDTAEHQPKEDQEVDPSLEEDQEE